MSQQVRERTSLRTRFANLKDTIAEHSRWHHISRKGKLVIGMLVLLVFLLFLLNASLNRYKGYNILLLDRYVTFDMPDSNTVTEKQWKKLVKSAKVEKYPKAQLDKEITYITNQYKKRIEEYGMTFSEYLEESNLTEDEFNNQVEDLAKQNVKEKLILHSISREKDIYVSDKELKEAKEQLMKDRGVTTDQEYQSLTGETIDEHAEEIDLESKLLYSKIVKNN